MGLADFLATAGQGKTLGHVAEAFGGQTTQQKAVDDFINNQLPALADQIHKAGTKEDVAKAGQALINSGLKAGINPQGLDKLMEMTIQPALRNMQAGELQKLGAEYSAQPAQPAQFTAGDKFAAAPLTAPPSGPAPITPSGNFADAKPEKPLDLNFMMKFGQATGANPAQFNQMLGTPADIAGKQASNKKTQGEIDKELQAQEAIKGLPNIPGPEGQPSQQAVASINRPGITQFVDQRAKNDPLEEKRSQVMDAQIRNLNHLADRPFPDPSAGADKNRTRQATVLRKEFTTLSKNFRDVGDSYNRIDAATKSNDPMSQVAAIYNFIKMQDPNIVTGSEFNLIQNARPLLAKYGLQSFERAWSGKRLDPEQVTQLRNSAKNLYDASARQHEQRVQEYSRLAEQSDINPRDVITEMGVAPAGQGGYSNGPSGSGSGGSTRQGQSSAGAMDTLPPAKDHPGKIVRDTKTGERMKSDGTKWVAIP